MTFEELKITRQFLNALDELGFIEPTPIQEKAIPLLRSGQDLIGIAQTGTGKTLAYILPVLQRLKYAKGTQLRALILVPTRELVLQVVDHIKQISKNTDLRILGVYGGVGKQSQGMAVLGGCDVLVATPGRFNDLYLLEFIPIRKLEVLILDEADRMLDMGFYPQLKSIFEFIPVKRQNLLFSATFSKRIEKLSGDFLDFPIKIEIAPQASTVETIDQYIFRVPNKASKINILNHLLKDEEVFQKVMIFTKTKKNAEILFRKLKGAVKGKLRVVHSNKGQNSRINAYELFREETIRLLIATDVSSRGIDIEGVSHVINYDIPSSYEDYVHRIGRTGRAKKEGEAFTFVTIADEWHIKKIQKLIGLKIPEKPIPIEVEIPPTKKEEHIELAREIDRQKKIDDPEFRGAFHTKKYLLNKKKSKNNNKKGGAKARIGKSKTKKHK